ncbi:MAG: hypothetical protein MH204_06270 [Fimbriimonadaceae bacterium]|nr:hypothetical protein [Fimbriimonadaceae bacterium]
MLLCVTFSLFTLAVFGLARDRSPQSTLRAFHVGLLSGDRPSVERTMAGNDDGPEDRYWQTVLVGRVLEILQTSDSIDLGRMVTQGNDAEGDVIYESNWTGLQTLTFVLKRTPAGWRIDAARTLARSRESFFW